MNQSTLRIVIYARLSKNRHGLSTNTAIQVAECELEAACYARDHGLNLVIVGRFEEDDVSASKYSTKPRPLYEQILQLVRTNKVDMIWSTETERLVRRPREMDDLIDLAETTDLREIYFTSEEGYDLSTPNGIYRARQAVNAAERESRKISRRVKRKLADNAREGKSNGGRRAYGYQSGNMELEPSEVPVIRDIAQKVVSGWSFSEVTWYLNEHGIKSAEGKDWEAATVRAMLQRKRYVGVREHRGTEYAAQWPVVFTSDEWEELQLVIRTRNEQYANVSQRRRYLLTGLLTCGKCGRSLTGQLKYDHQGDTPRRTYQCHKPPAKRRNDRGCSGVTVNANALDEFIRQVIIYRLNTENLTRLLNPDAKDASRLKALLADRKTRLARKKTLEDEHADGTLGRDEYIRMRTRITDTIAKINEEIAEVRQSHVHLPIAAGQSVAEAWDANPDGWRRLLIERLIRHIEIKPSHRKPRFQMRDGTLAIFDKERVVIDWREV
jgi:site-specific DNA recombinase